MSSGKSKTMPMQIFWGVEAVYYGIVQVENGSGDGNFNVVPRAFVTLVLDKSNKDLNVCNFAHAHESTPIIICPICLAASR